MFGSKSKEIARLRQEIVEWRESREKYIETINEWRQKNTYLNEQISQCKSELEGAAELNALWSRDYQQLNDRYSLLDSVLKQLQINVTLPVKKIARQN